MNWLRVVVTVIAVLAASSLAPAAQIEIAEPVAKAAENALSGAMICGDAAQTQRCSIGCVLPLFGLSASDALLPLPAITELYRRACEALAGHSGPPEPRPPQPGA